MSMGEKLFEVSDRITIMDGRVFDYSDEFKDEQGVFGQRKVPCGNYHISASRNRAEVHYARLGGRKVLESFRAALEEAFREHERLK